MDEILKFTIANLDPFLAITIILGGIFVTKYTQGITVIKDVHKILIASVLFSIIVFFIENCGAECYPKYLFTYLFTTSFYELLMKRFVSKITKK